MIDPEAGTVVGVFPGVPPGDVVVRPDSTLGRVFFMTGEGSTRTLLAFDQQSFALLGTLEIGGVSGPVRSLVRWGRDGLVFSAVDDSSYEFSSAGHVYLVRSPLVGDAGIAEIAVALDGPGRGRVTSTPGAMDCRSNCFEPFPLGTTVTLKAVADADSSFTGWQGCAVASNISCTVSLTEPRVVRATFAAHRVTLTANRGRLGRGTVTSVPGGINCGAACTASFAPGQVVTLRAVPGADSSLAGWTGCDSTTATTCRVTLSASRTVTAAFTTSDLRVDPVTAPSLATVGRPFGISTTVRNVGPAPAAALTLHLRLSPVGVAGAGDRLLTSRSIALAPFTKAAVAATVTIPADVAPGVYQIRAVVDAAGVVPEPDETNNVSVSQAIVVTLYRPDLTLAVTVPVQGAAGQILAVSNTVRNLGPAPAGAFSLRFHLSSDATLDAGDPVLGVRSLTGLGAGASSTAITPLRLPANVSVGSYYVIAVADALGQQVELDETNNVTAGSFAVEPYRPELSVVAVVPPLRGAVGQVIAVRDTVINTGLAPAGAFSIRFHLSRDVTLGPDDPVLGVRALAGLAPAASSTALTSLRLPANVSVGQYHVIAVADAFGQQPELDETDNVTVSPPLSVTLFRPDLLVTTLLPPVHRRQPGAGAGRALRHSLPPLANRVADPADPVLGVRTFTSLAAGALSTATTSLLIPANVSLGQYFIVAVADALDQQAELDETNNVTVSAVLPVTLYRPELALTALTAPPVGFAGRPMTIQTTVRNSGPAPAGAFAIRFHLSADGVLDAGDPVLGVRLVGSLGSRVSAPAPTLLHVPGNVSAGSYHVIAVVDALGQQPELDEGNNVTVSAPLEIRLYRPDLAVELTCPPRGAVGQPVAIGFRVGNGGPAPAGGLSVRFQLSADGAHDASDPVLGIRALGSVAAGGSSGGTVSLRIPGNVSAGRYHVIARVDALDQHVELDESNNLAVCGPFPVTLYQPELALIALTPPARGAVGQPMTVSNTVRNDGPAPAGAFTMRFHLSADSALDALDPVLGVRALGGLGAGASAAAATPLRIPGNVSPGTYQVIAVVDTLGQQLELDETNNVTVSAPLEVTLHQPNLTVVSEGCVDVVPVVVAGRPVAVATSLQNTGPAPAPAFRAGFHLSTDVTLDSTDALLGTRALGGLAAGAAWRGPTTVTIPAATPPGDYHVLVVADEGGVVTELSETDNLGRACPPLLTVVPGP